MAIKMVREPSETPNINNVDDIIPMRYAYGGQNGYVIGKGTEISNTINGTNFIINSGRLVLQGVECDIDATGVTIAIDNIATKRYYVVYLQVNLATNTVSIESSYDTADYPVIDNGDDLTVNSSGIARMVLYKFTAQNGVISEVNKAVESIKYTKDVKVQNAVNLVDGGTISSETSAVTQPATDISKKIATTEFVENKLNYLETVWSGNVSASDAPTITLSKNLNIGDKLLITTNDIPINTKYLLTVTDFYKDILISKSKFVSQNRYMTYTITLLCTANSIKIKEYATFYIDFDNTSLSGDKSSQNFAITKIERIQ